MTVTWTDPRAAQPPADPAQPGRPHPKRPARVRWAAASAAGIALLVVAGVLVLHPRPGRPPAGTGSPTPPPVQPTATSTAPHMAGGVLVGFPRTEAGARAAALNIDAALGSELMYSQGSRHALLQAIAVPDALPAVQAVGDATYTAGLNATLKLDAAGQPIQDGLKFVARRVPVGSMVAGWTPDSAVVQVWTVGLNGLAGQGSTTPVREGWETDTVTLRWAAGDWRYISETGVPGPVPVVGAQAPSDSAALAAAASGFGAPTFG